jgi:hypothetical protein
MKSNKTYILAAIFILLAVLAYFLTAERGEKTSTYKLSEKQFFKIDSAAVDKIILEKSGKKVTLVKIGIEWKVMEPSDYPVFKQFIGPVLSDLKNYNLESKVSDNPANKDKFGFNDTNVVKLTVFQGGNQVGMMLIGGISSGPSQTFIKKPDSDEIFLASEFLRSNFAKENFVNDWRDKLIVAIPKSSIKSVEFISSSDNYKISIDSAGKYISGKDSVNTGVFDGVLNMFQSLNTQNYIDSAFNVTKFDKTIKINADKLYELNFLKLGTDVNAKYLLKVSDIKQLFEVDENYLKIAFKPKKEIIVSK